MASKGSIDSKIPGYRNAQNKKKTVEEAAKNGFNGTRDRATSAAKAAQERGKTRTTQEKVKQLYNSPIGQAAQKAYNLATSEPKKSSNSAKTTSSSSETKQKKDPNRFKKISEKANASRTDEQKAAIEKNQKRIEWQNNNRRNNSVGYQNMMKSRTKSAMQKAQERNAANKYGPSKKQEQYKEISKSAASKRSAETNAAIKENQNKNRYQVSKQNNSGSYRAMMQRRTEEARKKSYEKAFGKGR